MPLVRVETLTVGELLLTGSRLPIVIDALGGAEGVLGTEGLEDKRIFIDFKNDLISITRSRNERPGPDYITVPLQETARRLLLINANVGGIRATAVIDTGGQASIGNLALPCFVPGMLGTGTDRPGPIRGSCPCPMSGSLYLHRCCKASAAL